MSSRRTFISKPLQILKDIIKSDDNHETSLADAPISESQKKEEQNNNEQNYQSIISDFTPANLQIELMRMGIDPSNLSAEQMLQIIYSKMDKAK